MSASASNEVSENKSAGRTLCVTGGSGFIASHIVSQLLQKGYTVRATVRDANDKTKNTHLRTLPGAAERLTLFSADLMKEGSFDEAMKGCDGVFHVATPMLNSDDGEKDMFIPGLNGLRTILAGVKKTPSVTTFILTSSMAAVSPPTEPAVKSEVHWSDSEKQKKDGDWYSATKTTQEQTAQKFFETEHKTCRFVAICPTMVIGPMLRKEDNGAMSYLKSICQGSMPQAYNDSMSFVDVRDTAAIHIAAYENPDARGRYLCLIKSLHWNDIAVILKQCYPKLPEIKPCEGTPVPPTKHDLTRMESLGVKLRDVPTALRDAINCLIERGEL